MAVEYHKLYSEVSGDTTIPASASRLYMFLLHMSNISTGETPPMYISYIAGKFNRKKRTVQKWLAELINRGLIIRVLRKDKNIPKWNEASYFIIVHAKAHLQGNKPPAGNIVKLVDTSAVKSSSNTMQKNSLGNESQIQGKRDIRIRDLDSENLTLNVGEPDCPQDSESFDNVSEPTADVLSNMGKSLEENPNPIDKAVNDDTQVVPEAIVESGTPKEKPVDKAVNHGKDALEAPSEASVATPAPFVYRSFVYNESEVPEAMRSSVEYLLSKTGRPKLCQKEYAVIREMNGKYTPEQIMELVDSLIESKKRRGKNIRQVTFYLVKEVLRVRPQKDKVQAKSPCVASVKAPVTLQTAPQAQGTLPDVSAPILPVEEAESIISEYTSAKPVKKEEKHGISPERQELFERIKARDNELESDFWRRHAEWMDAHSSDVDIDEPVTFDEDMDLQELFETDDMPKREALTLEDYLRLKFPDATDEELQRRDYCQGNDLEKAFDYDYTCAMCTNPETCPFNKKDGRAVVLLKRIQSGEFCTGHLSTAWTLDIGCKHPDADKETEKHNPEFEKRLERSGLTEWQSKQTFESYEHVGAKPEVVSAKAKAILAAKNKTSLVLAGKPGTGKTHLAIAIALDAMKDGRNAIFRTVPDLLDELARADWEHDDFFGLRQKFRDVSCLVLDDLGKEKSTPKKLEYLYQIIDYRYSHGLQTIITTNAYDMNELVNNDNAKVIEPLVSRVLQNGEWVTIREAENHRL